MAKGKYEKWITREGLTLISGWAKSGLVDEQIAHNMGIRRSTLFDWMKRFPDLDTAIRTGKDVADYAVENALYKRAIGYSYQEVHRERLDDEDDSEDIGGFDKSEYGIDENGDMIAPLYVNKVITKHHPPDTTAAIFWLKNRRPDKWRDVSKIDLDGGIDINDPYKDLDSDELKKLIEKI